MALLSRDEAKAILKKAVALSKADQCVANLQGSRDGNIRYALNSVTTAGEVSDTSLVVQSHYGKRQGTATVNQLDPASLERCVRRSEELARLAPENPEAMPVVGPQKYLQPKGWFDSTAALAAADRAAAAAQSIKPAKAKKLQAAGFFEESRSFRAKMTSAGCFGYHRSTQADFSVTVRTPDGTGSGYAIRRANDVAALDTAAASQIAIDKALRSREPKAIEPGRYTVILEPAASATLIRRMMFNFDARRADEGRSFLTSKEGDTKLGEKIMDKRVTIYSESTHPLVPVAPWAMDGRARGKTVWVDKGVVKNLGYSRYWAKKKEVEATPEPSNVIMAGGEQALEEMIANTRRGVLVTRTWYIRSVDPQTLLYTGLTRDGTFFIKDGKLAFPIKNMRFNESPVIMLNNLEALGEPQRVGNSLVPPMTVRDFNFTSLSDAV